MTCRSFERGNPRQTRPENAMQTPHLGRIESRRARGMEGNPIDLAPLPAPVHRTNSGTMEQLLKNAGIGIGSHEMTGLIGQLPADPFGHGRDSSPPRVLLRLEYHASRPLHRSHPRATSAERTAIHITRDTPISLHRGTHHRRDLGICGHGDDQIGHPGSHQRSRQI